MENGESYRLDIYKDVPESEKHKPTFLTLDGSNIDLPLGYITNLKEDGDFRSEESIEILSKCDIVVTNPPFSLFREFIAYLFKFNKKFLIIGNQNAITYKEIFGYLQSNQMWLGANSGDMAFKVPSHYEPRKTRFWIDETGQKWRSMGNICWYTNLDFKQRHDELILYKQYNPEEYPEYENYKAINIDRVSEIPIDYYEPMGVPITFMSKYNPEQFDIIWTTDRGGDGNLEKIKKPHTRYDAPVINGDGKYKRIIIKRKDRK